MICLWSLAHVWNIQCLQSFILKCFPGRPLSLSLPGPSIGTEEIPLALSLVPRSILFSILLFNAMHDLHLPVKSTDRMPNTTTSPHKFILFNFNFGMSLTSSAHLHLLCLCHSHKNQSSILNRLPFSGRLDDRIDHIICTRTHPRIVRDCIK